MMCCSIDAELLEINEALKCLPKEIRLDAKGSVQEMMSAKPSDYLFQISEPRLLLMCVSTKITNTMCSRGLLAKLLSEIELVQVSVLPD